MILKSIKYLVIFSMSYFVLSIHISSKPLFYYIADYTTPYTQSFNKFLTSKWDHLISYTQEASDGLFDSKVPKASESSYMNVKEDIKKSDKAYLRELLNNN